MTLQKSFVVMPKKIHKMGINFLSLVCHSVQRRGGPFLNSRRIRPMVQLIQTTLQTSYSSDL